MILFTRGIIHQSARSEIQLSSFPSSTIYNQLSSSILPKSKTLSSINFCPFLLITSHIPTNMISLVGYSFLTFLFLLPPLFQCTSHIVAKWQWSPDHKNSLVIHLMLIAIRWSDLCDQNILPQIHFTSSFLSGFVLMIF